MALSASEVLDRIENPKQRQQLDIAIRHEDRVKFSVKKCLADNLPLYYYEHLRRVENKIPKEKYLKYVNDIQFPLPHVKTADVIFSGLAKIWDSDKRTVDPQFNNPDLKADFLQYLEDHKFFSKFQTDVWEAYRSQPNSILVIDMPTEMNGRFADPYISIVSIKSVIDIDMDKDGNIKHLIYKNTINQAVALDEGYFQVWNDVEGKYAGQPDIVSWHGLNYCPAVFIIQDCLDNNIRILKESPVSKCLYDFDKLLFRIISGENLEDYAGYPVHVMRENECDYRNEQGSTCNNGYTLWIPEGGGVEYSRACPSCANKHLAGAGSAFGIMPNNNGDYDLDNALKIVSADVTSLDYKDKSIVSRENQIILSCLGSSQEAISGQAQNEKQITAIYESQQSRLMNTKRNIEYAMKFCIDAMAELRYEQAYAGCVVNLGTNFFLITVDQLQERLTAAIESNAPQYEIGLLRTSINETEWRSNPRMLQRIKILERLEPFPNLSMIEMQTLLTQNNILSNYFDLKYNFTLFVNKFEDENGNIVDFGESLQPAKKIDIIFNQLLSYASSIKSTPEQKQITAGN